METELDVIKGRDLTNYAILSVASFCIFSLPANDADSQPITCWHHVDSLTQDRIYIRIQFVR